MLKSHDQPTDVSWCAFVLPAVCGDVRFYARLITRVQAAEGGINAEFNVIQRLRVRFLFTTSRKIFLSELLQWNMRSRGEEAVCVRDGWVAASSPELVHVRSGSPASPPELQRCLELPGCYGADPLLPVSVRRAVRWKSHREAGAWPFPLPGLNTRLSTVLMLSLWPNQCAFPGVLLH